MIKVSKAIVNNKCEVTFDFTPQDVKYKRSNGYTATHKGGGTTARKGIWEGIECIEAKIKIGSNAWKTYTLPSNKKVKVTVSDNDVVVQASGKYRLKTMGYYWKDTTGTYPFFWYGNISGKPAKYRLGYFTDSKSSNPGSYLHTVNACVPADWTYKDALWSDWAYKHGQDDKGHWAIDKGRYEQRNANITSATHANGWISDSGYKQAYRKSSLFIFEKTYTSKITTSGIAKKPSVPELTVTYAKGDSGKITVKYKDPAGASGKVWIRAYCNGKQVEIQDYDKSRTFKNNESYTYTIDFVKTFGEQYRANDITYEAWAKNTHNYESAGTGKKGTHRFNGRPTVPKNLKIEGTNGLIYNAVKLSWDKSTDPDNDTVVYDIWVKAIDLNGKVLKDGYLANKHSKLVYDYDISAYADGTSFLVKVRANDNLLTSDWSTIYSFEKGEKPSSTIALIAPLKADTDIYFKRPRFGFSGYDGESICVIEFNGNTYTSVKNPDMFTSLGNRFMFKPNFDVPNGNITIKAYLQNEYGESKHTQVYKFKKLTATEKVVEGDIIKVVPIKEIQLMISNMGKAFNKTTTIVEANANDYYKASFYNECRNFVSSINETLNRAVPTDVFDYTLITKEVVPGEVNDDLVWEQLINDITNM